MLVLAQKWNVFIFLHAKVNLDSQGQTFDLNTLDLNKSILVRTLSLSENLKTEYIVSIVSYIIIRIIKDDKPQL